MTKTAKNSHSIKRKHTFSKRLTNPPLDELIVLALHCEIQTIYNGKIRTDFLPSDFYIFTK